MDQIRAMFEEMEQDAVFGEEMRALHNAGSIGEFIAAAAKQGFLFTEADWQAYIDSLKTQSDKSAGIELSQVELETVTGGNTPPDETKRTDLCYFWKIDVVEIKDGVRRQPCVNECETRLRRCSCLGTDHCVNRWHSIKTKDNSPTCQD